MNTLFRRSCLVLGLGILPFISSAQGTQLLRQPSLSAKHVVFVHANDLWVADRSGGQAQRLTTDEGAEMNPHISPDGQTVAFTGQYDGNTDVYTISIQGGSPTRMTWHPGVDEVQAWMPDGSSIIFRSGRRSHPTQTNHLYQIKLGSVWPEVLEAPRAAYGEVSPDGKYLAYTPITAWDSEWRNYRGGQAMPIWILNRKTLSLERTPQKDKERHMDPVWVGQDVYYLSERDYASNIWKYNTKRKTEEQITFHKDFDIKSQNAFGKDIVYEQGGYLHILNTETKKSKQLLIEVKGDIDWVRPRWETVNGNRLRNAAISPNGKRAVFEYRGDIFTAPKENGDWRNITQSSGAADRNPIWSPDGQQIAWFSDQSGEYQLMVADQKGMESAKAYDLPNPTFYFRPAWSPDGKHIAFTDTHYNLWSIELSSGEATKVDTDRFAHPNRSLNPIWSSDSRWIAYARQLDNSYKVIKVYDTQSKTSRQITNNLADAITPVWDASGKYLYFLASTDYGLNTGWLDMSSFDMSVTRSLYCVVLDKNLADPLAPQSDDEATEEKDDPKDSRADSVVIDFEDIEHRIIALGMPSRNYQGLEAGPAEHVFVSEAVPNKPGLSVHRYSLKKRKAEAYLSGVSAMTTSYNRKHLLYGSRGTWGIVSSTGKAKVGDGKISTNFRMKIYPADEWQQIFKEGWRYQRDFLYVENVHGAPWDKVYQWYQPWVKHVKHRSDLNYLVDILGGEVAVGHSFTRGGDYPNLDNVNIGLLGIDIKPANGYYEIEKVFTGETWNPNIQAPLSGPGKTVEAGDLILAVDGASLSSTDNFYSFFEGSAGRQVQLTIGRNGNPDDRYTLTTEAIRSENQLRSFDWVEGNRRKVDELSNGQVAYVYVPNTGNGGYTYFNRYYFSQQDKKGVIIDERNNGGGSAADYMIDIMNRKLIGYFNSRAGDKKPWTTPMAGIWGPKVMLINERAGSGGDLLPYMFKDQEIGPLIGTRTWGGLVGTWDTPPFIDGGSMVAPRGGFFDKYGEWAVEGEGIAPDIEVIQDPARLAAGGDPQLERAVQEALKLMKTESIQLKPEPAPPIRWKRPKNN